MRAGVVVAVLVMAKTRKTVLAMLLGCVATALIAYLRLGGLDDRSHAHAARGTDADQRAPLPDDS